MREWEADPHKYEAEYGAEKAISDEDTRAVIITEAPSALKQHLAIDLNPGNSREQLQDKWKNTPAKEKATSRLCES